RCGNPSTVVAPTTETYARNSRRVNSPTVPPPRPVCAYRSNACAYPPFRQRNRRASTRPSNRLNSVYSTPISEAARNMFAMRKKLREAIIRYPSPASAPISSATTRAENESARLTPHPRKRRHNTLQPPGAADQDPHQHGSDGSQAEPDQQPPSALQDMQVQDACAQEITTGSEHHRRRGQEDGVEHLMRRVVHGEGLPAQEECGDRHPAGRINRQGL